jgi:hypothetical protein
MRSCLLALLLVVLVPPLHATVIVPADFREVVTGSEVIAHGRVVDVRPEWADGRRQIDSVVTIDVIAWFKGGSDRSFSFVVPGGEIGRYRQVIVGAPVFQPGDEAFLFLKRAGAPLPYVFGLNQGVFRVRQDASGTRKVAMPLLLATDSTPEPIRRGVRTRQPIAVEAFAEQVRAVMASGGAR